MATGLDRSLSSTSWIPYLIEVLHEGHDLSVAETKAAFLAENHDLAEGDGAAVVGVDLVEKLLKRHLVEKSESWAKIWS